MRIIFERTGGIAGLWLRETFHSSELDPRDAVFIETQLRNSEFFDLPDSLGPSDPGADRFQYSIEVEWEGRTHRVRFSEAAIPPVLQALMDWFRRKT
jgi:hypothetical protein